MKHITYDKVTRASRTTGKPIMYKAFVYTGRTYHTVEGSDDCLGLCPIAQLLGAQVGLSATQRLTRDLSSLKQAMAYRGYDEEYIAAFWPAFDQACDVLLHYSYSRRTAAEFIADNFWYSEVRLVAVRDAYRLAKQLYAKGLVTRA